MHNKSDIFPIAKDYASPLTHPALREDNIWEITKDLLRPKARPFDCLQVEVTSCCSAKCSYCPHTTKAKQWHSRHMQTHTFANIWPLLKQATRIHLQGWGEPLLHPNFFDFVALARKAGCLVSSTSCGMHINENLVHKIINSGMDVVAFSLAGTDHESNSIRMGADFINVYNSIKLLQQLRKKHMAVHLEIHLAYILLADRIDAVINLPNIMQELDVHASVVSTLDYLAHESQANLAINPNDFEIISKAQHILKQASLKAKKQGQHIYYALPSLNPSTKCRENIQKSLYIDADGTVSPCIYLNVPDKEACRVIFGNVNDKNSLSIWEQENFMAFRAAHASGIPIAQCQNCVKKFEILL